MSQEVPEPKTHFSTHSKLKVTLLGSEWTSSAGGLSTLNRELAIHLSQHPKVEVSLLVPEGACKDEDTREAKSYGVTVVDAKKCSGYEPLDWLGVPPKDHRMDIVVGHGVKLGRQVQFIKVLPSFPIANGFKWCILLQKTSVGTKATLIQFQRVKRNIRLKLISVKWLI